MSAQHDAGHQEKIDDVRALELYMLSSERGASGNTVENYKRDIESFQVAQEARRRCLIYADTGDIRTYLRKLSQDGFAPRTQARKLSALRQFYGFLQAENYRRDDDDPCTTVKGPRLDRPLPKILSEDQVALLLAAARTRVSDETGGPRAKADAVRLLALVELLYATGLRVSELVKLPQTAFLRSFIAKHGTNVKVF